MRREGDRGRGREWKQEVERDGRRKEQQKRGEGGEKEQKREMMEEGKNNR